MTAPGEQEPPPTPPPAPPAAPDPTAFSADQPPHLPPFAEDRRDWMENLGRTRRSRLLLDLTLFTLSLAASALAIWALGHFRGWWH